MTQAASAADRAEPCSVILLIDDDPMILRLMARALEGAGFGCVCCRSGAEGLEALKRRTFDVVVSDIAMPGLSGIDVLRATRQLVPELPVVIVSGDTTGTTAQEARGLGAFAYLAKPLNIGELLALVVRAASTG